MSMYREDGKVLIKIIVLVLIIVGIAGYSLYQAKNLITGPEISLAWPHNGATLDNPAVAVKGIAKNIAYISLNDRQIFVDKEGNFNEELLLDPGYNVWKLEAKDKFGRNVVKKIELVLNKAL